MSKLKLTNDIFSESQLYKLAIMGCVPAFAELGYRECHRRTGFSKKFGTLENKFREYFELPKTATGHVRSLSLYKRESSQLCKFHSRVYEVPLRFLINPINTNKFNKLLIETPIDQKVIDFVLPLNRAYGSVAINGKELTSLEVRDLKFSIVWINWFFKRPAFRRPPSKLLNFHFSKSDLNAVLNYDFHLRSIKLSKESIKKLEDSGFQEDFIRLSSAQLATVAENLRQPQITKLERLFYIFQNMDVVKEDLTNFLPIFAILNTQNYDSGMKLLDRFFKLGYTRVLHAKIFNIGFLKLLKDKQLTQELNQRVDF